MPKQKVAKLLAQTFPLRLEVEGKNGPICLDLNLAWTMDAIMLTETKLRRDYDLRVNLFLNPAAFWTSLDCTTIGVSVWAAALQEHPEYADAEGFAVINSFLTPVENRQKAGSVLRECFIESLTKEQREAIREAERVEVAAKKNGDVVPAPVAADPIPAQTQN
jgi:hypothetical protein